ncbi:putative NADH-dependent flavin oxidoreductase [Hyaloraphidium curvatum]|nr:putative NADH-dependent flavin oxidoreductase [Hyaloraphidium curvatum]
MHGPGAAFTAIRCGEMELLHRFVMAPMTRFRSPDELANGMVAKYYEQRATRGGLLISEGTTPSPSGALRFDVPKVFDEAGSRAWKPAVDAVHAKGGYIYAQLWHVGRASSAKYQRDGRPAPSPSGGKAEADKEEARSMTVEEIKQVVKEIGESAKWAREAGFDGVELHGAHGYLIDQFLQTSSNKRTDEYGGPIANRARFLFEVLDAVLKELPSTRVAVRFSPWFNWQNCSDEDPLALFSYVLEKLQPYKLAYIHITEPDHNKLPQPGASQKDSKLNVFRPLVKKPTLFMKTGYYLLDSANEVLDLGLADLIGIGRPFIANPDLVERLRNGWPLTPYMNLPGYYTSAKAEGYVDFPTYEEEKKAAGNEVEVKA